MDALVVLVVAVIVIIAIYIGFLIGKKIVQAEFTKKTELIRADAIKRSRAVLGGQFSEQLAPYLPDFPYPPTEIRFIGKPIDFLVFRGMDNKDIEEVVFVEVKSGRARTSPVENSLKRAVQDKKVSWFEYRIPEDITQKKE